MDECLQNVPTLVDLFCGAGGLGLGFKRAGFNLISAVDVWTPAVATYRANLGNHVREERIGPGLEIPTTAVIAGGPPCQGFSSAGRRRDDDDRNSLVGVFAELVAVLRPRAFVFENVEGFLTGAGGRFVIHLLDPVIRAGYRVHLRKVNAANYGVPQHRKRVIAIGGLGWDPTFPEPTHTAHGAPGAHLAGRGLPLAPSVAEALFGLPSPLTQNGSGLTDHEARLFDGIDLERAMLLQPGQRMRDLPVHLWHESYRRRAFRRVKDGTPTARRGGAPAGVRRLTSDEPCKAITGGAQREFIHPDEHRALTIRECARLQTFPDEWDFYGTKAEKATLVGNAVPPLLAECIARSLIRDLQTQAPATSADCGRLLTFVPTLASGASPALEAVWAEVRSRFSRRAEPEVQRTLWQ